ncbi:MAG TPA: 30S ribosomal protein S6 [Solirubrobacterales bacterium]|nr:30S ribosomal protein S6 [Solirubrobacterales bacterium]
MSPVSTLTSEYELVLMLDPEAPDERRDQIAADALKRIEAGATLKHDRAWGMRKLAYEIRQRTEADYRFFRFESDSGAVLDELDHSLKITDGVLRFRIFKVDPDSPVIEPPPPVALASGATGGGRPPGQRRGSHGEGAPRGSAPTGDRPPAAAEQAPPAEAPAAPAAATPSAEQQPEPPSGGDEAGEGAEPAPEQ